MKELYAAMAKAFSQIEGAAKDKGNPAFKANGVAIKYATLESVVSAIKPALCENGLWFRQSLHERDSGVCVETIVCNDSGQEISFGMLFVPASKNDAQGFGSALTYARRYSLMTAFGVCPEDDDGNLASKNSQAVDRSVATIDDTQICILETLLEKSGADTTVFLAYYGVANITKLPASKFEDASRKLKNKLTAKVENKEPSQ